MPASTPPTAAALATLPSQPGSLLLTRTPVPALGPYDVLVGTIRVGICGTDREIIRGDLGTPPDGTDELVIGHEVAGRVLAVGPEVTRVSPGQVVTATVRRPDGCPACLAGEPDMCLWLTYTERGIAGEPGFLCERWVEREDWVIPVPDALEPIAVLIEPLTVVEKAVRQAEAIQRRLAYWKPERAIVIGAGPIGLLGTLLLRAKGLAVTTVARTPKPNPAANLVEASGAVYRSLREASLDEIAASIGNVDIILECSGNAEVALDAMRAIGVNGVEVLLSVSGDRGPIPLPADQMNASMVVGNKVVVGSVNAGMVDFVNAVERLGTFERLWPGLAERFITKRMPFGPDLDLHAIANKSPNEIKTVIEFGTTIS
ncbi:MAG: glucose 1-dehydrogenase [Thermomicrobiales bacterium]